MGNNYIVKDGDKWYQMNPPDWKQGDEADYGSKKWEPFANCTCHACMDNPRRRLLDPGTGYRILGLEETITQHYECMDVYSPEWKKYFRPEPTVKVKDYIGDSGILAIRIPTAAVSSETEWPKYFNRHVIKTVYRCHSESDVGEFFNAKREWEKCDPSNSSPLVDVVVRYAPDWQQITPAKMLELTGQKPEPKPVETGTEDGFNTWWRNMAFSGGARYLENGPIIDDEESAYAGWHARDAEVEALKAENLRREQTQRLQQREIEELTKERDALQKEIKEFWNPPMAQALDNLTKELQSLTKAEQQVPRLPKPGEAFVCKFGSEGWDFNPKGKLSQDIIEAYFGNFRQPVAWTSLSDAVWIKPPAPEKEKDVVERYCDRVLSDSTYHLNDDEIQIIRDFLKFQSEQKDNQ